MAVFAYIYFNNVVARQTVTVGYMLQKSLELDGQHMLELFTKLGELKVVCGRGEATTVTATQTIHHLHLATLFRQAGCNLRRLLMLTREYACWRGSSSRTIF